MPNQLPTPKFDIGQTVYYPDLTRTKKKLPCPDCLDTGKWVAESPAGVEFDMTCPRCSNTNSDLPSLFIFTQEPIVQIFEIGAVTVSTADWRNEHKPSIEYQSKGNHYSRYEENLWATEEEAMVIAKLRANEANAKIETTPEMTQRRRFSSLQFREAILAGNREQIFQAWTAYRQLRDGMQNLVGTKEEPESQVGTSVEELAGLIRDELNYLDNGKRDHPSLYRTHPIDALLDAINTLTPAPELEPVYTARDQLLNALGKVKEP